ncbi:MAG TPA: hypothetical protein V6C97_03430 [Oculatellaceae cyanobacterium]
MIHYLGTDEVLSLHGYLYLTQIFDNLKSVKSYKAWWATHTWAMQLDEQ